MRIIKVVDIHQTMDGLNQSFHDLPCPGACVDLKQTLNGTVRIMDRNPEKFGHDFYPVNDKTLVLRINNLARMNQKKCEYLAMLLSGIQGLSSMILASDSIQREYMEIIAQLLYNKKLEDTWVAKTVHVASTDAMSADGFVLGDMMYYRTRKDNTSIREIEAIAEQVKNGVPVLIDWSNNNGGRISTLQDLTGNSDDVYILSGKPQTTRRVLEQGTQYSL